MPFRFYLNSMAMASLGFCFAACSGQASGDGESTPSGNETQEEAGRGTSTEAKELVVWTPEQGLELQRAAIAAEPREVIQLGEGVFEPFWTPSPVLIRGAGRDKTSILYPVGSRFAVLFMGGYRDSGLEALHVGMKPLADGESFHGAWNAVEFSGSGTLRDVSIGPWDGKAVSLERGIFSVENLRIEDAKYGVSISVAEKGSVVDGLVVSGTSADAFDLDVQNFSAATFRNLELSGDGNGAIAVAGDSNALVFENLDTFTRNDILYEGGATTEGIPADDVLGLYYDSHDYFGYAESFLDLEEKWASNPERREAARKYVKALESANSAEEHGAALVSYITELSPLCRGRDPQNYFINTLLIEQTAYIEAYGLDAFKKIFFDLPPRDWMKWEYYPTYIDNNEWAAEMADFALSPPTEKTEPKSDPVKMRSENMDAALAKLDAWSADNGSEGTEVEEILEEVRKIIKFGVSKSEKEELSAKVTAWIDKTISGAAESGDTELLVELLAGLPTLSDDVLPSRRDVMRAVPAELRAEVVQKLRNR